MEIFEDIKNKIDEILEKKGQIILYGPPGTGKTYLARKYVEEKTNNDENKYKFITFHQSYSYEDFIEGFRPKVDENGNIKYEIEDGIFKKVCILALYCELYNKMTNDNYGDELKKLWNSFLLWQITDYGKGIMLIRKEETEKLKCVLQKIKEIDIENLDDKEIREIIKELDESLWSSNIFNKEGEFLNQILKANNMCKKDILIKLKEALNLVEKGEYEKAFSLLAKIKRLGVSTISEIFMKMNPFEFPKYANGIEIAISELLNKSVKVNKTWESYKQYIKYISELFEQYFFMYFNCISEP